MDATDLLRADQPKPPRVKQPPFRVVEDAHGGDPFTKIVEVGGTRYRLDEAALVELEEQNNREIEMAIRMGWFGASPPRDPHA